MKLLLKNYGKGVMNGLGFMSVIVLALAIAWAQDIFQVEKDGTPRFKVTADGKIPVGSTGSYEDLMIRNNATEPNNKVDITANVITVEGVRLESLSVTATLTTSGAGGLDTGSEAGSAWYYVWVITNNDGTSSNGLLSASSTSPAVPSGYTKKRRVGAVRNDASSNFLQFVQEGNLISYLAGQRVLANGTALTYTAVACSSFIPPTSRRGVFEVIALAQHNVAGVSFTVSVRPTGSTSSTPLVSANLQSQVASIYNAENDIAGIPTNAMQQIDYKINNAPNMDGGAIIDVIGYYDRI